MIAAWMLFATAVGLLVGVAALGAEPLLAARRRPRRTAWIAAMALAVLWPAAAIAARHALGRPAAALDDSSLALPLARASGYVIRAAASGVPGSLDTLLLGAWAIATSLLLFRLGAARRRLERSRRGWSTASLEGVPVRLSEETGPAVVGLREMEIVLPPWVLSLDEPLRALVLRHEEEHRAARDPHLLFAAALAVALAPWNVALWWYARRLRLAVEMDCDARVLHAQPRAHRYGMLLVAIAQRSGAALDAAPALSEPVSDLERRIVAMNMPAITGPRLATGVAGAVLSLFIACSLGAPVDSPTAPPAQSVPSEAAAPESFQEFRITKPATPLADNRPPRYPDELRVAGVEGEVLTQLVVDTSGRVASGSVKVLRSTDPRFTAAVLGNLESWRFSPAEVDGRRVRQLLEMPFTFALRP